MRRIASLLDVALFMLLVGGALLLIALCAPASAQAVSYDIVYVRAPRFGDTGETKWPEVANSAWVDGGADLVLLHPDGSEEVLVDCDQSCSVTDPFVTFDGRQVLYVVIHEPENQALRLQPRKGSDIYRIDLESRQITKLTDQTWDLLAGAPTPPWGVLNLGPVPLAGGRIAFTSTRQGLQSPRSLGRQETHQLYVMDEDGSNVELIAPMNIASALHPTPLQDGRIIFSSMEVQGIRDLRTWALWSIWPDGRNWGPVVSAFDKQTAFHFQAQVSDGSVVVIAYYNSNNAGFGQALRIPPPPSSGPGFHPAANSWPIKQTTVGSRNANVAGQPGTWRIPFSPVGMTAVTEFTHRVDNAAPCPVTATDGCAAKDRMGKVTHPSGAPGNGLLLVWSPGPVNPGQDRPVRTPYPDGGIYVVPDAATPLTSPGQLVKIKNDPAFNEQFPRAVVPWSAIHGEDEPVELPWLPNDGSLHAALPAGTPYGLVGTSSMYNRESAPASAGTNWVEQGSDAGTYSNSEIAYVRIVAQEPHLATTERGYTTGESPFGAGISVNERMHVLGEVPLVKTNPDGSPILDPRGDPDTSFLAKIPADTPFTFQMLDGARRVLTMAQTWHQVRAGEKRVDCGGCHAHSSAPVAFEDTAAAQPGYQVADLAGPVQVIEWDADIQSIFAGLTVEQARARTVTLQSRLSQLWQDAAAASREQVARWIDLGAPAGAEWSRDTVRPTVALSQPRRGANPEPLTEIVIGLADAHSGVDLVSLEVYASFPVQGLAAGSDLSDLAEPVAEGIWRIARNPPCNVNPGGCPPEDLSELVRQEVRVQVEDGQGNLTVVERSFSAPAGTPPPEPEPFCGDGTCGEGEDCLSCEVDCGPCPPPPPPPPDPEPEPVECPPGCVLEPVLPVVNVNTADQERISYLPAIGPTLAQRIIDHRTVHGSYTSVEQLDQVSGIGPATIAKIEPYVVLTGPTTADKEIR